MKNNTLWDILRDPHCNRCDLRDYAQYICLIGRGPHPCDIMMIGEAPGHREDDIGKPFAGRAGKLLDEILESIGISRNNLYLTNIVHCRPPENKTPKKKQMDACRYWLLKELEHVQPKKIVLMGRCAVYGLFQFDDYSVEHMRGRIYKYKGSRVYVTYHPAAALRRPYLIKVIRKDLQGIFGRGLTSKIETEYSDLTTPVADEWIKNPPKSLALDIETKGGFIFYKNPLVCLSFSPKAGVSYFVENPVELKSAIRRILEDKQIIKIGHHLKFDLKQLLYEGYVSEKSLVDNNLFCTMIAFNILDENYLDKDLEHLSNMFTSIGKWKNDNLDFSDPDRLRLRNLKDADATKRLYNIFKKKLENEKLLIPFKIDMDLLKVLVSAELHGIKIDVDALNNLDFEITKKLEKLKYRIPIDKPNSNLQLTEYFGRKGIKSYKETEAGGQSWDKNVLKELSNKLEGDKKRVIDDILEWKKLFGIQSKFLNNIRNFLDHQNLVHPVFNQVKASNEGDEEGTVSGRLSCKNPPLQQVPRDKEELEKELNPRRLFIPTHPKGFILSADYDQIEVRIAAEDANDEKLIDILKSSKDVHYMMASEVFQKPESKIKEDERKQVKKIVFGIRYKISVRGLAQKIGSSEERAEQLIRFFFKAFPKQEERIAEIERVIIKDQEISNLFGRKRRLPGATQETGIGRALIRQGVNFPIQSGAVDIVKIAMYKIWKQFLLENLRSRIFSNTHDAIDIDGYPGEEDSVIDIVRKHMTDPGLTEYGVNLRVPLKAVIKKGPNWLDLVKV